MYIIYKESAKQPLGFETWDGFRYKNRGLEEQHRPEPTFSSIDVMSFEHNKKWVQATLYTTKEFADEEAKRLQKVLVRDYNTEVVLLVMPLQVLVCILSVYK